MLFIKASKANKLMKKSDKILKHEKMKMLNKMIKEASQLGKQYIDFHFPLDESIIENLKKYGYEVEVKNYTYFTILW